MARKIQEIVGDYIHEGKQVVREGRSMVLTVGRLGTIVGRGSLDFGGSEYAPAPVAWQKPVKKSADDKYGWWHLEAGSYLLELNESLLPEEGEELLIQIWDQAARTGVYHPTELVAEPRQPLTTVLQVPNGGVDIKENARITRVTLG